jgi:ketosteroid isomerase-like protein
MDRAEFEQLASGAVEDWNREGALGFSRWFTDDIELQSPPEIPGGGTFRGRDAAIDFMTSWERGGGGVRLEFSIVEILEAGDEYLVILDAAQIGDASGIELGSARWYQLVRLRDGKVCRERIFLDREEALRAAGLSD